MQLRNGSNCRGLYKTNKNRQQNNSLVALSQITSRFTSNALVINHFESAESRSEVQPFVLRRCFVCRGLTRTAGPVDLTRSWRSEQIGLDRFLKSSSGTGLGLVGRNRSSDQFVRAINPSKNRTECCQSLLPMPEAAVLAGVKSTLVGSGSELGGHGNQRVWMSGVGVWSRRTLAVTVRRRKIFHFKNAQFRRSGSRHCSPWLNFWLIGTVSTY